MDAQHGALAAGESEAACGVRRAFLVTSMSKGEILWTLRVPVVDLLMGTVSWMFARSRGLGYFGGPASRAGGVDDGLGRECSLDHVQFVGRAATTLRSASRTERRRGEGNWTNEDQGQTQTVRRSRTAISDISSRQGPRPMPVAWQVMEPKTDRRKFRWNGAEIAERLGSLQSCRSDRGCRREREAEVENVQI